MNIKNYIVKPKSNVDSNMSKSHNLKPTVSESVKYPYWAPNNNFNPAGRAPIPKNNPWIGDHSGNFPDRGFQTFFLNNSHNGYQS